MSKGDRNPSSSLWAARLKRLFSFGTFMVCLVAALLVATLLKLSFGLPTRFVFLPIFMLLLLAVFMSGKAPSS